MADTIGPNDLRTWHEAIMAFANHNYEKDGWDCFVECIGVSDFANDYFIHQKFVDFASAMEYYRSWCKDHDEYRKDIYATAF